MLVYRTECRREAFFLLGRIVGEIGHSLSFLLREKIGCQRGSFTLLAS
jgi:hypothetical protein